MPSKARIIDFLRSHWPDPATSPEEKPDWTYEAQYGIWLSARYQARFVRELDARGTTLYLCIDPANGGRRISRYMAKLIYNNPHSAKCRAKHGCVLRLDTQS